MKALDLMIETQRTQPKKFTKRSRRLIREIENHFSDKDYSNPATIHALRVNLKRVEALITLLNFNGVKLARKNSKAIRSFFIIAGKLRSVQVEFDIISHYFENIASNPDYLHQLHEKKKARLTEYTEFLKSGPSKKLRYAFGNLKKKIDHLTQENISDYLSHERKKLAKRIKGRIFREQELHLIRKNLKRFYLNMETAGHANKRLEALLDLLGSWHDHQIAFDHIIKTIYAGRLTESEKEPIIEIKDKLIIEKERLFEEIILFYVSKNQPATIPDPG